MFPFFRKNSTENVDETLKARLQKLETRLTRVEAEILDVATAQDIIRNKVLRKIQIKKEPEENDSTISKYSQVLIPEP